MTQSLASATETSQSTHPSRSEFAIETVGLNKRFGSHLAVNDVNLQVPRGSVFGFLGPNGSGKTTTIRVVLGLATPTSGRVNVLGEQMPQAAGAVLPRVGALVEGPGFAPYLSGRANLMRFDSADRFATGSTRMDRVDAALERVGLTHAARKKVKAYSLGMKQRLGIANALLTPRDLLILDEPTNGLDPQGTREVRALVRSLAAGGTTVFVSSHLLAEIEQMCTHAGIMSAGKLVAQGTLDELRGSDRRCVRVSTPDRSLASAVLKGLGMDLEATDEQPAGEQPAAEQPAGERLATVVARFAEGLVEPHQIVQRLVEGGVRIYGFSDDQPSLEERFVALTGDGFEVAR